jgi:hypothetical protein
MDPGFQQQVSRNGFGLETSGKDEDHRRKNAAHPGSLGEHHEHSIEFSNAGSEREMRVKYYIFTRKSQSPFGLVTVP